MSATEPRRELNDHRPPATVSAVIPVYNGETYVGEAIRSVLTQTHTPVECVVIDDGSTDATEEVVRGFIPQVTYARFERGGGAKARNRGIQLARGELVAFLDHDDVWLPTKLERQLEALRNNPETPMALCAVEVVDANDAKLRTIRLRARGDLITGMLMFDGTETVSCNSTGVMRREWLLENGGYDPVFTASEDWDLLRRTVMESDVAYVDEPLVRYRVHGSNLHWDVATIERNMRYAFAKALADPRMPPSVRAKRRRAYGRLYRMLAGSYRDIGNNKAMLRCLSRAIGHDPTVSVELLARLAGKLRR